MKKVKVLMALKLLSWIGLIGLFIVISMAAIEKRNNVSCDRISVRFKNDKNLGFIGSKDVLKEVQDADPAWKGQKLSKIKFNLIENSVKQNEYVKRAELFLDNQNNINVLIEPKQPIARIHSSYGSYYLSEKWDRMSLSRKYSKRVIHISGRVDGIVNPKNRMDSFINTSLQSVFQYIEDHCIWETIIDQIHIRRNGKIEFTFIFCEPIIKIGYVDDNFEKRMNKVHNFFKTVSKYHNLSNYKELDFQFSQQVIARI